MLKAIFTGSFALVLIFLPQSGTAAETPAASDSNLYFLATENQVKLLNQKLEYRVQGPNSIQVGNLVISTDNLKIIQKDQSTVTLEGPTQFMVGGTLILKDPHGRAVWSNVIKDITELQQLPANPTANTTLRTESAQFDVTSFDDLLEPLTQASFFSFCIFTETKTNRIQVCTPNYSIQQEEGKWNLTTLDSSNKENLVIVNGTEVNEHGIIQFDQNIKTVSLAAKLASGLSTEVKTDYIELDLLDIFFDEPQSLIHLKLREKSKNKKVYPWNTELSLKDPYLYIEAYGQVPLRQEVAVNKEELPLPSDRPLLVTEINKTYLSEISLSIQDQPNLAVKAKSKGDLSKKEAPFTQWNIKNLKYGLNKPHLLGIVSNQKTFIGAYEIERRRGLDLSLQFGGNSQTNTLKNDLTSTTVSGSGMMVQLAAQKYFDSFLGSYSSFNHLRWSSFLSYAQGSFSRSQSKVSLTDIDLGYRLTSSFHHLESSSTLKLGLLHQTAAASGQSTSALWLGFKLSYDGPNSLLKPLLGSTFETQLSAYPVCLAKVCKNGTLLNAYWQSRFDFREKYYWSWKGLYEQTTFKEQNITSSTGSMGFQLGFGMQL